MKHVKTFENNDTSDSEITKMFQELKYHDEKHREIDIKLANICKSKLKKHLVKEELNSFEIKKVFYDFYKNFYKNDDSSNDTIDFSFEKEMVLMWLNRKLKMREEANKYNL